MIGEDTTQPAYEAARRRAAWIDRSREGRIAVTGADRVGWLQGLLTNDVARLQPGHGCYAAYLTPQGRMVTDVRVLVRAEACWLDVPGTVLDGVLQRLDAFVISEDVTLVDRTRDVARLAVHGPAAAPLVAAALGHPDASAALGALREHHHLDFDHEAGPVTVAASFDLGGPGVDLYLPTTARDGVVAAFEAQGIAPLDEATWETCRIEAGRPAFGVDMGEDTIPLEAGLEDRAISYTKGCYVGQEIIVRVRDRGHGRVARRLVRLVASDPAAWIGAGDAVHAGGREVGRVSSATRSPAAGRALALAMVHRDHATNGGALTVRHDAADVTVVVRDLDDPPSSWTPS